MSYSKRFITAFNNKDFEEMMVVLLSWEKIWRGVRNTLKDTKCEFKDIQIEVATKIWLLCEQGKYDYIGDGQLASLLKIEARRFCIGSNGRTKYNYKFNFEDIDSPEVAIKKTKYPLLEDELAQNELNEITKECISKMNPCCQVILKGYGNDYTQKEIFKKHEKLLISCGIDTMHKLRYKMSKCLDELSLCVAAKTDNF